ncbi:hypothetical protein [Photobacterium atrarenae]|uniref:Uncharacterized protein n=1 Tax=Photobacterium atrarenae TaxID=865757 RepID=A0ABY5GF43_9GAMM|nr:hypothetical protein [Photobacterium atrarenae]UTV27222.1 hypothetical protein NNL38_12905 [Photobacterium atrarenae]
MYKGHWYDVMGKERMDIKAITLDFENLNSAVEEALSILPETSLIVLNQRLGWGLIAIEDTKRMLICRD